MMEIVEFSPNTVAVVFTWHKLEQVFTPIEFVPSVDGETSNFKTNGWHNAHQVAVNLKPTVGKTFQCSAFGEFIPDVGLIRLQSVGQPQVGNGTYRLVLGNQGESVDGFFFLRRQLEGMTTLRMRREPEIKLND